MEAELRCPVCHDYFNEPLMLQCSHHICAAHMDGSTGRDCLWCPVCGDVTAVPNGGLCIDMTLQAVADLWRQVSPAQDGDSDGPGLPLCGFCEEQPASRRCVQCNGALCAECEKTSHSKGFFKNHNIVDCDSRALVANGGIECTTKLLCHEHLEEKLSFYCLSCRMPVCSHCLILGDHQGHQQTPIDQAFETGRETLKAWVETLQQRLTTTEDLLERLGETQLEISKGADAQRNTINRELDHLREMIDVKHQQLLSKSALEEKPKQNQLQAQFERAEAAIQDASSLTLRSLDVLALPSEHAFLAVVQALIQDMKKSTAQPIDDRPWVSGIFRTLSTDPQVKSLGELDLGIPPRVPNWNSVPRTVVIGRGGMGGASTTAPAPATTNAVGIVPQPLQQNKIVRTTNTNISYVSGRSNGVLNDSLKNGVIRGNA